jgi:hypothetical protein
MDNINPVIIGNAIGNTILLVVSHLLAPNPKLACLNVSSTANDSSVVLMITGSTNNPNVNHKIEFQIPTYSQIMTSRKVQIQWMELQQDYLSFA